MLRKSEHKSNEIERKHEPLFTNSMFDINKNKFKKIKLYFNDIT
jgi:hypothetical protein